MTKAAERIARNCVLRGWPIPSSVQAQLEARGIDVGDLYNRIIQQKDEQKHDEQPHHD